MALYVARVSPEFISKLAREYLEDYVTMHKLAKKYSSSAGTISDILFRGVVEQVLDEITAVAVATKVCESTENVRQTQARWKKALDLRLLAIVEQEYEYQTSLLRELQYKLETYDQFFFGEQSAPAKNSLEREISQIQNKLFRLKNRISELKGE